MLHVIESENWKRRVRKENEALRNFQDAWKSAFKPNQEVNDARSQCGSSSRVSTVTSTNTSASQSSKTSSTYSSELRRQLHCEKLRVQQLEAYIHHMHSCPHAKK